MSAIRRLFRGENNYDFVRLWRFGLIFSGALLVLSVLFVGVRGLDLGLDFEGGTSWEVPTSALSVGDARDVLRPFGEDGAKIQQIGGETLRVQSQTSDAEEVTAIREALAEAADVEPSQVAVTTVGPTWGGEISRKAIRALVLFFIAIAVYITLALRDWRMAVGSLAAVAHDIVISVGVYAVTQIEVTPATVIAFLTILGFSLYDTVVVFARIRENTTMVSIAGRMTYTRMASLSLNQVLMRSLNTTITALLPVISMLVVGSWIFGATTLEEFALALLVGLFIGAYSSIFVATPITAWLNERSPQYRTIRQRLAERGIDDAATATELAGAAAGGVAAAAGSSEAGARSSAGGVGRPLPPGYSASHPPRPRKKRR